MLQLDDWVRRLANVCPPAAELTPQRVRQVMEDQTFRMEDWEGAKPASHFKYVLHALASTESHWLYASDWRGSRVDAARAFETLLNLPENHVSSDPTDDLDSVAWRASKAAQKLGTSAERLHYLAPYDDDCVFALLTPALLDVLVANELIASENAPHVPVTPPTPTLMRVDELMAIEAFSDDAQNLFQNMALRTVGDLLASSRQSLARACRNGDLVRHVERVLKQAGLRIRASESSPHV